MRPYKIIDKTFKIYTPETLDPKQEDLNMSSIVTSVDGIGSGNYIVARLFIQTCEALEKNILKDSISFKDILSLSYDCKEFLLSWVQLGTPHTFADLKRNNKEFII